MKNSNDIFDQSTSMLGENCKNSHSYDAQLSALFGSVNEKITHSEISLTAPPSSGENCVNLPSDHASPHSGLVNEQTSHSEVLFRYQVLSEENKVNSHSDNTPLKLLTCSVMSLPIYNGGDHMTDMTGRSPEEDAPSIDSAPKASREKFGLQTLTGRGRTGEYGHLHDTNLPASTVKSSRQYGKRKSTYRGVTRHRWSGKYEAHLWDGSSRTEGHTRKGKQVYLGGYETAEEAARAYDLTALKYWSLGASSKLNFPIVFYKNDLEEMESMSREEFVTSLRRKSICFTRGSSIYRGVTRNREGQWQARIKVISCKKDIFLGRFSSEEEAARAYDIAAIELRGMNALTNFDVHTYLQGGSTSSEELSPAKRVRRKFAAMTSSIADSDCQPDASVKRSVISTLLPEHPKTP